MRDFEKVEIIDCKSLSYEGVSAYLSDYSLHLSPSDRSDISYQAKAEFDFFCFNQNNLIALLKASKEKIVKIYLESTFLGELNQYSGYLRAAEGSYTRPIKSLNLEVSAFQDKFEFNLDGKAGDLIPWTYPANQAHEQEYYFKINFSIAGPAFNRIIEKGNLSSLVKPYHTPR